MQKPSPSETVTLKKADAGLEGEVQPLSSTGSSPSPAPMRVYSLSSFTGTDLASALRAGRFDAQAELVRRYQGRVATILNRVLGKDPEIQDLVQEVFAAALAGAERFKGTNETIEPWLLRIAVNRARKTIRRRSTWRRFFRLGDGTNDEPADARYVPSPDPHIESREIVGRVERIVGQMAVDDRILFGLRYVDGMSVEEVGDVSGVSKSTIKRRLRKVQARFEELAQLDPVVKKRLEGIES